jgi:hypothetical protein
MNQIKNVEQMCMHFDIEEFLHNCLFIVVLVKIRQKVADSFT